jgi:hypothetical protein
MVRFVNAQVNNDFVNDRQFANVAGIAKLQDRILLPRMRRMSAAFRRRCLAGLEGLALGCSAAASLVASWKKPATSTCRHWHAPLRTPTAFARTT